MLRLLSKLFPPKTRIKHSWREQGEANQFMVLADITHPDGSKETMWVAAIQLNGEMPLEIQTSVMALICRGLDT